MTTPSTRRVDLRGLPPPEPLVKALEAARGMRPGDELVVVTERRPAHLLPLLHEMGLTYRAEETGTGHETWINR